MSKKKNKSRGKKNIASNSAVADSKKSAPQLAKTLRTKYSYRHLMRFVIEFDTPLHIGSGREGEMVDAEIVTDANGLAAIPGDSLCGVLRAAFSATAPEETDSLFGFQEREEGQGSRLNISWGHVHDSHGRPVDGIIDRPYLLRDEVLLAALLPESREHVRISHKGAAERQQRGLFSEATLCAGHRFTFEMELISADETEDKTLATLLAMLNSGALRLGGKTRRGFGAFHVVAAQAKSFNLKFDKQFREYCRQPVSISEAASDLVALQHLPALLPPNALEFNLKLTPCSYWFFGGGDDLETLAGNADLAPMRCSKVVWQGSQGRVHADVVVLPGTGIKGPIAHRTAFHYNRLAGHFADVIATSAGNDASGLSEGDAKLRPYCGEHNQAVQDLFGYAKNNGQGDTSGQIGRPGKLLIDDIYLVTEHLPSKLVQHGPLGRFSAGSYNLFSERPFWQGPRLPFRFVLIGQDEITDQLAREALVCALRDLAQGRLQLGAGRGRGEGYFTDQGTTDWQQLEQWASKGGVR